MTDISLCSLETFLISWAHTTHYIPLWFFSVHLFLFCLSFVFLFNVSVARPEYLLFRYFLPSVNLLSFSHTVSLFSLSLSVRLSCHFPPRWLIRWKSCTDAIASPKPDGCVCLCVCVLSVRQHAPHKTDARRLMSQQSTARCMTVQYERALGATQSVQCHHTLTLIGRGL